MEEIKNNSGKIVSALNIIIVCIAIICVLVELTSVYAQDFSEISLKVEDPAAEEYFALILIPESYVKHVGEIVGYRVQIEDVRGNSEVRTRYLRYFNTGDLLQNLYTENGVKYLQLKLENIADNFTFNVAPGFSIAEFKLRMVTPNSQKMFNLGNYELEDNGDLKLLYDYETQELKTNDKLQLQVNKIVVILGVLLIVMCLVNFAERSEQINQKRKNY